jgi:hypothetical protein
MSELIMGTAPSGLLVINDAEMELIGNLKAMIQKAANKNISSEIESLIADVVEKQIESDLEEAISDKVEEMVSEAVCKVLPDRVKDELIDLLPEYVGTSIEDYLNYNVDISDYINLEDAISSNVDDLLGGVTSTFLCEIGESFKNAIHIILTEHTDMASIFINSLKGEADKQMVSERDSLQRSLYELKASIVIEEKRLQDIKINNGGEQ